MWVRDLVWLAVAALLLLGAYATRAIIVPILVGLALAYVFNPFVTYMRRRHEWPRWATTAAVLVVTYGAIAVAITAATPPIIAQGRLLFERIGGYAAVVAERLDASIDEVAPMEEGEATPVDDAGTAENTAVAVEGDGRRGLMASASERLQDLDPAAVADFVVKSLDVGVGVVGSVVSFASYIVLAVLVVTLCFFFFSWQFGPIIAWFGTFIPAHDRERTLHILGRMDESISAFIRGRLIQSIIMTVLLSIGWWIVGVKYWLLLGVVTGLLNLVPYAGVIGFLLAVGLSAVDQMTGGSFSWFVPIGAAVVYLIAQGVDGWVVEPVVQGKATDLDPLTILLVVLIGGSLAGLLGLILAIPVAACVKILSQEVLLPRIRAKVGSASFSVADEV